MKIAEVADSQVEQPANHVAAKPAIMRYLPKSPADRQQMLREIGVRSIDELFSHIPAEYRLNRDLKITRALSEAEIIALASGTAPSILENSSGGKCPWSAFRTAPSPFRIWSMPMPV